MTRHILVLLAALTTTPALADVPNVTCTSVKIVYIKSSDGSEQRFGFRGAQEHDPIIYRFSNDSLYLTDPGVGKPEYRYNKVIDESLLEPGRYRVGFKTIIFSRDLTTAVDTHTDQYQTKISWLKCVQAASS